jgi:hypothetical protein
MGIDKIRLDIDDDSQRFHLCVMIRAGGPRDGEVMGWAVVDTVPVGPVEGSFEGEYFPTKREAEAHLRHRQQFD